MDSEKPHSVEIIRYTIPDGEAKAFEDAYRKAGNLLRESKFCTGYNLYRGEEEPEHYVLRIVWTSKDEHINGFRKSPIFSAFFDLVKPFYSYIEEMKHFNDTGINWKSNSEV